MVVVSTGLHAYSQIKVGFPEVEFLGSTSKYKKKNKKIGVYVLYDMSQLNVSRCSRAVRNVQKCMMHVQSCSFLVIKLIFSLASLLPSALWLLKLLSIRLKQYCLLRFFLTTIGRRICPRGW